MKQTIAWVEPSAFPQEGYVGPTSIYSGVMMPRAGAAMAARLAQHGYKTVILSGELTALDPDRIAGISRTVCLSTLSNSAPYSLILADQLKQRGCTVIMGGYHFAQQMINEATLMPTVEALSFCDYVIRGEGYDALPQLLEALSDQRRLSLVSGLSWRDQDGYHHNSCRQTTEPARDLPMPNWQTMVDADQIRCLGVQGVKGCPRACSWCAVAGRDGRGGFANRRDAVQVVDEIEQALTHLRRAVHLFFTADNLVVQVEWLKQVCDEMIRRRVRVPWTCQAETPTLAKHPDLLEVMAQAGCVRVCLGLESVSVKALTDSDKASNVQTMTQAVHNAHQAGIAVHGMFIVGLPGDGEREVRSALDWCHEHRVETAQFLCLMGLPGSNLTENDNLIARSFRPFKGALAPLNWLFMNGHYAQLASDSLDLAAVQQISLDTTGAFYRLDRVFAGLLRPQLNVWRAARRRGATVVEAAKQMAWSQIVTAALRWRGYSKTKAWRNHPLNQAYLALLQANSKAGRERALDELVRQLPEGWVETLDRVHQQRVDTGRTACPIAIG